MLRNLRRNCSPAAHGMARTPRVAILGVGGVGGVLGACLETAGRCQLTLVSRGACLERLQPAGGGLEVVRHDGEVVRCCPKSVHINDAATLGPQDYVIVCTKAHQFEDAAIQAVSHLLGQNTRIVPMMNGLPYWFFHSFGGELEGSTFSENHRRCWEMLDPARAIGCVSFVAGEVVGPGYAHWSSKWPASKSTLTFGDVCSGGGETPNATELASLFDSERSALPLTARVVCSGEIRREVLEKMMVNASINTLCTLARADCGQMTARNRMRDVLRRICEEVTAVALALDPPISLHTDSEAVLAKYEGQYGLLPSMLQDLFAGRRLESVEIVDLLAALGHRLDVPTPTLEVIGPLLETLDATNRKEE